MLPVGNFQWRRGEFSGQFERYGTTQCSAAHSSRNARRRGMGRLGRGCPSMFWCLGLCQFRKFWKGLYIGLAVAQWHNRRRADDHENDDEEAHPPSLLVNPICCTEVWVHFNLLLLNWETVIYIYISQLGNCDIYIYTLLYLHGRFRSKRKATYRFCFWKLLPNPDTYELTPPKTRWFTIPGIHHLNKQMFKRWRISISSRNVTSKALWNTCP